MAESIAFLAPKETTFEDVLKHFAKFNPKTCLVIPDKIREKLNRVTLIFDSQVQADMALHDMNNKRAELWNNWQLRMYRVSEREQSSTMTEVYPETHRKKKAKHCSIMDCINTQEVSTQELSTITTNTVVSLSTLPLEQIDQKELLNYIQHIFPAGELLKAKSSFLHQLHNAQYDETTKVLRFCSEGTNVGSITKFKNEMYVLPEYESLFELMWRCQNKRDILILATEGMGKSYFGLYCMHRFAKMGIVFMYEESPNIIELSLLGCTYYLNRRQAKVLMREPPFYQKIFYLCDLNIDSSEPDNSIPYKYGICLSSPHAARYKYFEKMATTYYMKLPSFDDLRAMKANLSAFQSIPLDIFEGQLQKYGPIARNVLDRVFDGDLMMNTAISHKGKVLWDMMVGNPRQIQGAMIGPDSSSYNIMVHLDSIDNHTAFCRIASTIMAERIAATCRDKTIIDSVFNKLLQSDGVL